MRVSKIIKSTHLVKYAVAELECGHRVDCRFSKGEICLSCQGIITVNGRGVTSCRCSPYLFLRMDFTIDRHDDRQIVTQVGDDLSCAECTRLIGQTDTRDLRNSC